MRRIAGLIIVGALVVAPGCGGDQATKTAPTATVRPIPAPVAVAQQPLANFRRADPTLPPLAGAKVDVGQLGGSGYQIEMPDTWNGRLVLYMHGCWARTC